MNEITADIKALLEQAGFDADSSSSGAATWAVYENYEPDSPNQVITIFDGGDRPLYTQANSLSGLMEEHDFQIRVRGYNPEECKAIISQIRTAIENLGRTTINSLVYHNIIKTSGPFDLGYNESSLSVWTVSFQATRG